MTEKSKGADKTAKKDEDSESKKSYVKPSLIIHSSILFKAINAGAVGL